MKKILSIILLIGMLMSMVLIIPASALSDEETNLAAGLSYGTMTYKGKTYPKSFWRWSVDNNADSQKIYAHIAFDGVKSHTCENEQKTYCMPTGKYNKKFADKMHDINGLQGSAALSETKYRGLAGWYLPETSVVDTIKIYMDDVAADGTPCKWLPDHFVVAVSATGAAGSWTVVYDEEHIRCEKKYQVYEEGGKKTAYIEVKIPAELRTMKYFEIGLPEDLRCTHEGELATRVLTDQ